MSSGSPHAPETSQGRQAHHQGNKFGLNDLPEELLEQIASQLNTYAVQREIRDGKKKARHGTRDAYSFCLVSRKFYRIGKPYLYSVFVNDNDPGALHKFVARSVRNPELLNYLRAIVIGEYTGGAISDEDNEDGQELRAAILDRLRHFDVFTERERGTWPHSFDRQDYEAYIALLMGLSPNLETIDLTYGNYGFERVYFSWCLRLISWAIQHTVPENPTSALSSLRTFVYRESPHTTYPGDHRFWEAMMLPSLRKVELHYLTETREGFPYWLERISNVDTLIFRPRSLTSRFFESIARACRELKSVTYTWDQIEDAESSMDVDGIFRALRMHQRSLTKLTLECRIPHGLLPAMERLPPLKDFMKLRHLHISGAYLVSSLWKPVLVDESASTAKLPCPDGVAAYFPSCLESFALECLSVDETYWHHFITMLRSIGEASGENFPHLRILEAVVPSKMWEESHNHSELKEGSLASSAPGIAKSGRIEDFLVRVALEDVWDGKFKNYHFQKES